MADTSFGALGSNKHDELKELGMNLPCPLRDVYPYLDITFEDMTEILLFLLPLILYNLRTCLNLSTAVEGLDVSSVYRYSRRVA